MSETKSKREDWGRQSDLARRMGMSRQAVHEILSGRRVPGRKLAEKLERATGIPRLAWLYPDQNFNPLLKKNGDGNGTRPDPA